MKHIYIVDERSIASLYGVGTYINHVVTSLQGSNFRITVVEIYNDPKEPTIDWKNNIRYIRFSSMHVSNHSLDLVTYNERIAENISLILYPYIDRSEQNIFHFNITKDYYLAKAFKKYYDCKVVLTVHCSEWSFQLLGNKEKLLKMLSSKTRRSSNVVKTLKLEQKLMADVADEIIAIASHSYNDLINIYNIPEHKITLIRNAIPDQYKPVSEKRSRPLRKRYFIKNEENLVVFAGRLNYVKGVDYLIRAFKKVLTQLPDSRLIIIGDGVIDKELYKLAAPCWSKITFTGFIDHDRLYDLFSIADIGVLPSLHEEFGLVALEMMMCRLPIIVNDSTGLSELIEDGVNGLKFKIKQGASHRQESVTEIANQIIKLLQDKVLQYNLALQARNTFVNEYTLSRFKQQLTTLYDKIYK